jgi:hypothetical protein
MGGGDIVYHLRIRQRRLTLRGETHAPETTAMTPLEFLLTFSIFPLTALILGWAVFYFTRHDGRDTKPPE